MLKLTQKDRENIERIVNEACEGPVDCVVFEKFGSLLVGVTTTAVTISAKCKSVEEASPSVTALANFIYKRLQRRRLRGPGSVYGMVNKR